MGSEGGNLHLLRQIGEVLGYCDFCRAFSRAPHVPIAGASTVSAFNAKLQVDIPPLGDIIALHVMDVFPKFPLLAPVRSKNPQEVGDASANLRIGICGPPKCIRMHAAGEGKNEVWTDFCSGRRIKLLCQGVGARHCVSKRRSGLAREICNCRLGDDPYSGRQILAGAQWRPNTMISASGYSAFQFVFGSNPVDLNGWDDQEGKPPVA